MKVQELVGSQITANNDLGESLFKSLEDLEKEHEHVKATNVEKKDGAGSGDEVKILIPVYSILF